MPAENRKRVLVTGGTGFVGANLVRALLQQGQEVYCLVRPAHKTWRLLDVLDRIHFRQVDLAEHQAVKDAVREISPHWIFDFVAYGAYPTQFGVEQMIRTNLQGTVNLAQACLDSGCESFIHAGSSSEYGFKDHAPPESELPEPNSDYAVSKCAATLYCGYMARAHQAPISTVRLYSVYGPWEEPTRLIPSLVMHGLAGKLPPLADPATSRDFIYIDDVVAACLQIARKPQVPGTVFNLGTSVETNLLQVVNIARDLLQISEQPQWGTMDSRSWDTAIWRADISRMKNELGWTPEINLKDGMRRMVEFVRTTPSYHQYCRQQLRIELDIEQRGN